MIVDQYNELVAEQQSLYASRNPTRRWLHCIRRDWIVDHLSRMTGIDYQLALEVGPGSGIYLPHLSSLFSRVVAVDVEHQYLNHLQTFKNRFKNIEIAHDDITNSQQEANSFDLVLCTEVLEHIKDSRLALRGIHRLLKPGGVLLVTTPQAFSTMELSMRVAYLPGIINIVRWVYQEPVLESGHINLMTSKQMRTQLTESGFLIEKSHRSGLYLPLIAEFAGELGLRIEKFLEDKIATGSLQEALWTQYYIARKPM